MTSKEIVKAAIAHQTCERIPTFITLTNEMKEVIAAKYGDVEEYLGNDVSQLSPPWWAWGDLEKDWQGELPPTSLPKVKGIGSYEKFTEDVNKAKAEGKYVLAIIFGSHFEKAYFARGFENFLADMGGEEEFARALLNDIIRRNLVMLENILQNPDVDGVLLGSDWGSQLDLLMSLESWDKLIRPGEQSEYDMIHRYGKDVWVHSCGNITKLLPRLIEMGVNVLNPLQPECMDNLTIKHQYGDHLSFWCGVSTQNILPYGTPEEVFSEALKIKEAMGKNGGFIFAPSQSIQTDVPLENLDALVRAGKQIA